MPGIPLAAIEWHDLPAAEIRITQTGLSLIVAPYKQITDCCERCVLRITHARTISFNMIGTIPDKDLGAMEISTFTCSTASSGLITGTIGLLHGQTGFWELSFTDARWEITGTW